MSSCSTDQANLGCCMSANENPGNVIVKNNSKGPVKDWEYYLKKTFPRWDKTNLVCTAVVNLLVFDFIRIHEDFFQVLLELLQKSYLKFFKKVRTNLPERESRVRKESRLFEKRRENWASSRWKGKREIYRLKRKSEKGDRRLKLDIHIAKLRSLRRADSCLRSPLILENRL